MSYKERVNRVIDFIGKHLDEELELDELCRIACFSKYHFHRLFTSHAGVSLKSYIKWLRLKRAAHQLTVQKEDTIINIALDAGFESHEAFSRAFKQVCGQSPSGFRSNANWRAWENPPYSLHIKGKKIMTITIKDLPSRRLAMIGLCGSVPICALLEEITTQRPFVLASASRKPSSKSMAP